MFLSHFPQRLLMGGCQRSASLLLTQGVDDAAWFQFGFVYKGRVPFTVCMENADCDAFRRNQQLDFAFDPQLLLP